MVRFMGVDVQGMFLKLHALSVYYAHKLVSTHRGIENKSAYHSHLVLEPGPALGIPVSATL
eukprot:69678-Pelagomonas_calceolata.AAC.1